MNPTDLVQAQLDAYNAHDVDALLTIYAPDARHYEYPDRLLAEGTDALRERMAARFAASRPRAELLHRVAVGNTVIDHERIVNQTPTGPVARELIAIYEVVPASPGNANVSENGSDTGGNGTAHGNGRIASARFVFGGEYPASR